MGPAYRLSGDPQQFLVRGTFFVRFPRDYQIPTSFTVHAMDPYDSDSSVDEDFTETNVLLGYADEEVIEDTISHLGGWPVCSPGFSKTQCMGCVH